MATINPRTHSLGPSSQTELFLSTSGLLGAVPAARSLTNVTSLGSLEEAGETTGIDIVQ